MLEAIATGTPVVAVPFAADQPSNALFLQKVGAAVSLSPFSVTKTEILLAIEAIVNDTRYFNQKHCICILHRLIKIVTSLWN